MVAKKQSKFITKNTVFYLMFVVFWAGFSLIASQFIFAYLLNFLVGQNLSRPFWLLIYYLISYASALALILFALPRFYRFCQKKRQKTPSSSLDINRAELGLTGTPTFTDMGLAPIGYVVYALLANLLTAFFSIFSWFDAEETQNLGFAYFITTADRVFAMLAVVFIAPIAEEIIMRGWLYGKLRSRAGIFVAIFLTSLTFAFLHGQWNVAVVTFALSVVLCGLHEITGTIYSGIILHILVNGVAFYLRYVAQII